MNEEQLVVKCTGCGIMLPEDEVCDAMEEETCPRNFSEQDDMKELNFSVDSRSNPYEATDHSPLIADVEEENNDEPRSVQEFVRSDDATKERIGEQIAKAAFARQESNDE